MKKSDRNKSVIENFAWYLTHCSNVNNDPRIDEKLGMTNRQIYAAIESYIAEDHTDGRESEEDHIVTYGVEGSFVTEDPDEQYSEQVVVVADYGDERGTETVVCIDGIDNRQRIETLLAHFKSPY